jgi:hypothetical protein
MFQHAHFLRFVLWCSGQHISGLMTSLFQQSTSLSSVAILQHHLHMEYTLHNSYIILGHVQISDFLDRAQLLTQKLFQQG